MTRLIRQVVRGAGIVGVGVGGSDERGVREDRNKTGGGW